MEKIRRKKLSEAEREDIHAKCNGHCGYCGKIISYEEMQIDHMTPLKLGGADEYANLLPSCRSCNHYKATLDVEGFRKYLTGLHARLIRDSIPYQVGERFGIVEHVTNRIEFYFEKMSKPQKADRYEVRSVVCDHGVFEDGKMRLICNSASNARLIVEIMNRDSDGGNGFLRSPVFTANDYDRFRKKEEGENG